MACTCISFMDEALKPHNSRICVALLFGGDPGSVRAHITTEKIEPRNRNKKSALATFCPFCGVAYASAPDDGSLK